MNPPSSPPSSSSSPTRRCRTWRRSDTRRAAAQPAATVSTRSSSRGLCEVLERDAFMIVWANRLSLPLLDVDRRAAAGRARSALRGHRPVLRRGRPLGLPSPAERARRRACARRAHRRPRGGSGHGAHRRPSVVEGAGGGLRCRAAGAKLRLLAGGPGERLDRLLRGSHPPLRRPGQRRRSRRSSTSSRARTPVDRVPEPGWRSHADAVAGLCDRVEAAGSTAYVVDVTSPDVRELGLSVGKVLAPELCPLDVPHAARFLGGRRLYDAAVSLGLRDEPLARGRRQPRPASFPVTGLRPARELCPLGVPPAVRFLDGRRRCDLAVSLGRCDGLLGEDDLDPDPHRVS